ncbi:Late competence development protein ComFB [Desulfovibrio sp. X2]|uniref:late competence development ComFB family protein n=1 Tax=Desulfovibrio sp. X2 TaxID=941449 RepID=UPI0003588F0D|nr:late competence development ComFB family protein [Desulfovibrio sp. X2]EPR37557.1 Late competence development protein ComFB [Desulfovibrio sp. X2]
MEAQAEAQTNAQTEARIEAPEKSPEEPTADRVRGALLEGIRNRNEPRVAALLPVVLDEFPGYEPSPLEVQDIYALALNLLPPRYAQSFSFVIREEVSDDDIREQLRAAAERVRTHPKADQY